jgi:hypothetical protein
LGIDTELMAKAHWFAGMVTTGADPVTPVSAIENSSMLEAWPHHQRNFSGENYPSD